MLYVKFHPKTGQEGPEEKRSYSCTLSSTWALDEGGCSMPRPNSFAPRNETWYPQYRSLCGPQGRSRQVRKISPRDSIHETSSPQQVTISTALSQPFADVIAVSSSVFVNEEQFTQWSYIHSSPGMYKYCHLNLLANSSTFFFWFSCHYVKAEHKTSSWAHQQYMTTYV
jgi:hypothetical protein